MNRFTSWMMAFAAALLLSACGGPEPPENVLENYITEWEEGDYSGMYTHFTKETRSHFSEKEFTDQYGEIMNDIEASEITVTLPDEKVKQDNEQTVRLPFEVEMKTLAGPVAFQKEAVLKLEETEEGDNWLIDWDPGYLLPDYAFGDKVRIQELEAERGRIFDRNGSSLAVNGKGVVLGVSAGEVDEAGKKALADVLGLESTFVDEQLKQSWVQDGYFVPLKTVSAQNEELIQRATAISGAVASAATVRTYPYGAAAAHVTGYTGEISAEELKEKENYKPGDVIGKRGLEQLYEEQLREKDGVQLFIEKEKSEPAVVARTEPENGKDVNVTIHAEMQKLLFDQFEGAPGAASAADPKTGDVLALVSSPSFDPNEFTLGLSAERYRALQEDPKQPLLNRFVAAYSPGSTMKPIIAAAAIKAGALDPAAGKSIEGLQWQPDSSWGNYSVTRVSESAEPVTLQSALAASDNIYFAMAALDTGAGPMKEGLLAFGFGEENPFPYPLRDPQVSNSGTFDSDILLADTGYGQGEVLTTMTHLSNAYGAFLNGGTIMKPQLLTETEAAPWKENLLTESQAAVVREGLRGVVEEGTARAANIEGMAIAGKTGTAELKEKQGTTGTENGLFVAYNADNPAFVLALLVEDAAETGGSKTAVEKVVQFYKKWKEYE